MALFGGSNGRTEKATPKRRGEARKKGQTARSPHLAPAVVFLGLFWLLGVYGTSLIQQLASMLQRMLSSVQPTDLTEADLQKIFIACFRDVAGSLLLLGGAGLVLSVGANAAQGGLVLSGYRLRFHLENLNPASGIKRLLPGSSFAGALKAMAAIGAVGYLSWSAYSAASVEMQRYVLFDPRESARRISQIIFGLALKSGVILLLIAILDYFWSRRQFEQSIRMTKQEVKDEARNAEGSPEIRAKIRKRQRETALRSMMADVKKSHVVITNPTHYAVALRYEPQKTAAPIVVAKGKGFIALRIRELAMANQVPLVENKPLAQTLFKSVIIGQQIPASLFKAVAEVLAYVYRLKGVKL